MGIFFRISHVFDASFDVICRQIDVNDNFVYSLSTAMKMKSEDTFK